jgi:hypothetical protein
MCGSACVHWKTQGVHGHTITSGSFLDCTWVLFVVYICGHCAARIVCVHAKGSSIAAAAHHGKE